MNHTKRNVWSPSSSQQTTKAAMSTSAAENGTTTNVSTIINPSTVQTHEEMAHQDNESTRIQNETCVGTLERWREQIDSLKTLVNRMIKVESAPSDMDYVTKFLKRIKCSSGPKKDRKTKTIPDEELIDLHNQFQAKIMEPPLCASLVAIAERSNSVLWGLSYLSVNGTDPNRETVQDCIERNYYSSILLKATDILLRNREIANKLEAMSGQSQAEKSMSYSDGEMLSGPPNPREREDWEEMKPLVAQSGKLSSPHQFESWDTIGNSNGNNANTGLNPKHQKAMRDFNTRLQQYFSQQIEYEKTKGQQSQQTFRSFGKISKKDGKSNSESTNCDDRQFQRSLEVLHKVLIGDMTVKDVSNTPGKFLPSLPRGSPEVSFVQPVMKEILHSLGFVLQGARGFTAKKIDRDHTKYSPAKTHVQKNRPLQGTEHRMGRVVDKSIVSSRGRFVYLLRDDSMEIPIEVKPSFRGIHKYSVDTLVKECQDQIVGHMAKHLMMGFNSCGVGHDTIASGIVLFETGLWALQLQLVGMGTTEAQIVLHNSGYLPIMDEKSLEAWLNLQKPENKSAWEKKILGNTKQTAQSDVPSGIIALCQIMTCERSLYVGHKGLDSNILGPMIGYGSYSVAHAGKGNASGKVLKLSRYGLKKGLQHEARILEKLKSNLKDGVDPGLFPTFCDIGDIEVIIRHSPVPIHALTMEPRGIPVDAYLSTKRGPSRLKELLKIGTRISDAIEHIHRNKIFHNDVSPQNILVRLDTGAAFLNDFGSATKEGEAQIGFVGTPQYCHKSIFFKYPSSTWKPDPTYDKTSLAFCVASLVDSNGVCPWPYYHPISLQKTNKKINALERELFWVWVGRRSEMARTKLSGIGRTTGLSRTARTKLTEMIELISYENSRG